VHAFYSLLTKEEIRRKVKEKIGNWTSHSRILIWAILSFSGGNEEYVERLT